jgi:hypothetical protein
VGGSSPLLVVPQFSISLMGTLGGGGGGRRLDIMFSFLTLYVGGRVCVIILLVLYVVGA